MIDNRTLKETSVKTFYLTDFNWAAQDDGTCDRREYMDLGCGVDDGGIKFFIKGAPFKPKAAKWLCRVEQADVRVFNYIILFYKAEGLLREKPVQPVVSVSGVDVSGIGKEIPLLKMSNIIADGFWHRIIVKKNIDLTVSGFTVDIASNDSAGFINVRTVEFVENAGDLCACCDYLDFEEYRNPLDHPSNADFSCIDLEDKFNFEYSTFITAMLDKSEVTPLQKRVEDPVITDGGRFFTKNDIVVEGIPFKVKADGLNLVSPPEESTVNDEIIEHFGLKVKRGSVAPVSRDDLTELEINARASEVYFLMAADMPATQQYKFIILESVVEGQLFDEIREPFRAEDVERFAVELIYGDGTSGMAFPYLVGGKRHIIQGMFGAYAVPAEGRFLKKVVFHNRIRGSRLNIAAVTINKSGERLYPELFTRPKPRVCGEIYAGGTSAKEQPKPALAEATYIKHDGNCISIGNSDICMDIDISQGFSITRMANRWIGKDDIRLVPSESMYFTVSDLPVQNSGIRLISVKISEFVQRAELVYSASINGALIEFGIELRIEDKPEINMKLTAVNKSGNTVEAGIIFPAVKGFQIGSVADTWYLFPKYRNILSNGTGTFSSQASPTFPMQFYDIFNPALDAGFYVMTKELDHTVRSYGLSKAQDGITYNIQYPELYTHLKPGVPFVCSDTVIGAHKGDWHSAAESYGKWLETWYRPCKAQSKQWYKECFWLTAEITDTLETGVFKLPAWYDEGRKHYKMKDIIEEQKRVAGRYPDILHFWAWCYSREEKNQIYGGYCDSDYEKLGGLENFKKALDDVQYGSSVAVSLYLNATLCHQSYPIAKEIGLEGCMRKKDGSCHINEETNYRMCHSFIPWREYMIETYKRVYAETGAKILYVDEFSLLKDNICFSADHGHDVPLNLLKADNEFIKALRSSLPEELALYGEFPPIDVNSQYIDCNITYYNVDMVVEMIDGFCDRKTDDGMLSPVLTDLYRFIFPGIVQLNLPVSIRNGSWHPLKFTFFNGEAIYDSFWDVEETRAHEFILKAYDIKKEYADCFTSGRPEMLVETEMEEVCANKFPGNGRVLWTLYNRAYSTVRGELISVIHNKGAEYYDVWNGRAIVPRMENGRAHIMLEIGPQSIGCICCFAKSGVML